MPLDLEVFIARMNVTDHARAILPGCLWRHERSADQSLADVEGEV